MPWSLINMGMILMSQDRLDLGPKMEREASLAADMPISLPKKFVFPLV